MALARPSTLAALGVVALLMTAATPSAASSRAAAAELSAAAAAEVVAQGLFGKELVMEKGKGKEEGASPQQAKLQARDRILKDKKKQQKRTNRKGAAAAAATVAAAEEASPARGEASGVLWLMDSGGNKRVVLVPKEMGAAGDGEGAPRPAPQKEAPEPVLELEP